MRMLVGHHIAAVWSSYNTVLQQILTKGLKLANGVC